MISARLRYLSERMSDAASRNKPFTVLECHAAAQQLSFYAEMVERMEHSVLAPQDEVMEAMISDAA